MKKIFILMVSIGSILAILVSCAKEDDDSSSSSTTSATTTTPSGSITMGSYTVSGVYLTECQTSGVSTFIALGAFPSDVKSYGFAFVVTGDDNITTETHTFTDTGCTTSSYVQKLVRDNVTLGTASGANYPVTYNATGFKWTVNTTTAETFLENLYSSINLDMTVGTEKFVASTGSLKYNLVTPGDTTVYIGSESSSSTPSSVGSTVYTKE